MDGVATVLWKHRDYSIVDTGQDGLAIVHENEDVPWRFIDKDTDFAEVRRNTGMTYPMYVQYAARRCVREYGDE